MNRVKISNLVPLNFVSQDRTLSPSYHFKHFDKWTSGEQIIRPFYSSDNYYQKWQSNDIIFLQVESTLDPLVVELVNESGDMVVSQVMDLATTINGKYYFQSQLALTGHEGIFSVRILAPGFPIIESEKFCVKESQENTILYKYSHDRNTDVAFETGIYFTMRVEGALIGYTPISRRTTYNDQTSNIKTVTGQSSRQFTNIIGGSLGVPDYIADKIIDIFNLNNVQIDGKYFTAAEGAKLEPKREDIVSFAGWTIDVAESYTRRNKVFEADGLIEQKIIIDYTVEGKLFGPVKGPSNDNTYTINEIG